MGDYLYSRAVIELVKLGDLEPLRVLSRVTNEMTVGEMRQLLAHDRLQFTEEEYDLLIRAKTASLISGACEVGALRAHAGGARRPADASAQALGMAFQIVDDLLDYTEDAERDRQAVRARPREHKVTLPLIAALPHCHRASGLAASPGCCRPRNRAATRSPRSWRRWPRAAVWTTPASARSASPSRPRASSTSCRLRRRGKPCGPDLPTSSTGDADAERSATTRVLPGRAGRRVHRGRVPQRVAAAVDARQRGQDVLHQHLDADGSGLCPPICWC